LLSYIINFEPAHCLQKYTSRSTPFLKNQNYKTLLCNCIRFNCLAPCIP